MQLMFGKKSKTNAATEPTVIGRGTAIEGTVRVTGRVQVDGQIDGSLVAEGHVSVGPSGVILGEVVAHELVVGGRVEGKVSVTELLHIAPNGIARGEMRYGSLCVDRGGVLDGSTARGDEGTQTAEGDPASSPPPLPARAAEATS
jgi:cytoskeletal protein CcmA (bactofilin family)